MTWPTLRYPLHTIPQDYWDPSLQAWQMAWSGHILLHRPAQLWHANTFYPESWSFAFSDTLLGYAPAGMLGTGPEAAVLRYNIIFVLAHALATFGAYALARQLGAGRIGGAVAGVGFAYAPWLLAQAGHLHVISNGGIPLALAMLARGHGYSLRYGYRPRRSHAGWAFAGWLVATWQISLGFGIGLPFVYILAGLTSAPSSPGTSGASGSTGRPGPSAGGCSSPTSPAGWSSRSAARCSRSPSSRSPRPTRTRNARPPRSTSSRRRCAASSSPRPSPGSGASCTPAPGRRWAGRRR